MVRKRGVKKQASTNRKAQLEDKLEDLVTLLRAQQSGNQLAANSIAGVSGPQSEAVNSQLQPPLSNKSIFSGQGHQVNFPTVTPAASASSDHVIETRETPPAATFEPSSSQAEEYLRRFCAQNLQQFPFYYIPSTTTAAQLQHEKPFFWLAIQTVSCTNASAQQIYLSTKFRETIAKRVVVDGERNIDLLLGLLAFLPW